MNERILISGAGVAGLALAYWLARHGFGTTVVERAPALRTGGNGVDVRAQAVQVAERMGLMARIRERAADVRGMKFVDVTDRTVARVRTQDPASVEIMRGDLLALLDEVTDTEYLFDDSVQHLKEDGDGVLVTFERAPARRFHLVVGADGMHSTVRRLAFGLERRFVHFKEHYFAFANADASLGEDRWVTMFNTPGRMTGIYRSGHHAQAKAYFMFRSAPLEYDPRDVTEHKRLIRERFAGDSSWRIRELLDSALTDPEFYFDALGQVKMSSWHNGRVALVGDAAWCASPASGAGAELALVGAYRLAGELAAAGGDHRAAFRRYQTVHRPLVDRKQQIGPNVRIMIPRTAGGRFLRDTLARLPLMDAIGELDRHRQARSAAPLPSYSRP
ncbi:FAD-dependent monooxygenase [Streptomyces sp. NRRL B-3648]|uniref:FAD-dependent monooxygenase n=1 Tax=Streptomyces sp. NRRL B-3648 TaxID=1519493 RepID=UPI0006B05F5C|nr:FAD-dependent monooxygenase [Streptomyces sp. NRRL B-3648]KOX11488.1 hypothetical protein ADL04_00875 [Streptomyces sp. NRRL B-3648]